MSDRPIVQYRAMGSRRGHYSVVGCYVIPKTIKPRDCQPRAVRLRRWNFTTIQWGLTHNKALKTANALNTLNNLPLHEAKPR